MGACCMAVTTDSEWLAIYCEYIAHIIMPSCENNVLWRGHFNATGSETAVNLTIYGGECAYADIYPLSILSDGLAAFAASVWINDKFISTVYNGDDHINALFTFPVGSVIKGKDNVITVLQDNMGNDEDANEKSARGISAFQLNGGTISQWKVQGKVGGYTK